MSRLVIITTDLCNMACRFCIARHRRDRAESVPLDLLAHVLDQARGLEIGSIRFTGGEPCLHPEFDALVGLIAGRGFGLSVVTNGFEWERYRPLAALPGLEHVTFSLESHRPELNDALRREGAFDRAVEGVRWFVAQGVGTHLSVCVTVANADGVADYVRFADALGVDLVRFTGLVPTEWNADLRLDGAGRQAACRTIRAARRRARARLVIGSSLRTSRGAGFCQALDLDAICLYQDGQVGFCCDLRTRGAMLGSARDEPLAALMERARTRAAFLRQAHVQTKHTYDGSDTCDFCYRWLAE